MPSRSTYTLGSCPVLSPLTTPAGRTDHHSLTSTQFPATANGNYSRAQEKGTEDLLQLQSPIHHRFQRRNTPKLQVRADHSSFPGVKSGHDVENVSMWPSQASRRRGKKKQATNKRSGRPCCPDPTNLGGPDKPDQPDLA